MSTPSQVLLPEGVCPNCGYKANAATSVSSNEARPMPGEFTVCAQCAGLSVFDEDLRPRKMLDAEWASMTEGQMRTLERIQYSIRAYWAMRKAAH